MTARAHQYPCKGCGASLEFDPSAAALECPYCNHREQLPETEQQIKEYAYNAVLAKKSDRGFGGEKVTASCSGCAATMAVDPQVEATRCAYCDLPMIIKKAPEVEDLIRPEAVLPFVLEKPAAEQKFREWIDSRWFAPAALKKLRALQSMHGVYRPYWTFDTHTVNHYSGERGDHYTVTVGTGKDRRTETRTRWTSVSGTFRRFFDDVLIDAGRGEIWREEFDPAELKPYEARYLAGWEAETYSLPLDEGWKRAQKEVASALHSDACGRIGGDTQRSVTVSTAFSGITYKHVLLPLFIASYRYRDKVYHFQVNGQTGAVHGERPWSFWKLAAIVAAIVAAVLAVSLAR